MEAREKITQLRVGIFLAIGLAAVAMMVVYFGRFGDGLRSYYEIRVEYPNASGLLKGASVLLAGAKVGLVNSPPTILPDMNGVYVMLKIYEDVKIPSASEFSVGSSGLLGDRFVVINLKENAKTSEPIQPGAVIQGTTESDGFGALAESAGDVMQDVRTAVQNINRVAEKLDKQVLSDETLADLKQTIANLEKTSASFSETSTRVDELMVDVRKAVTTGDATLVSTKAAAEEFQKTMSEIRTLVSQARQGRGVLGALLSDRQMADNMRALVENLRRHGVLFYKDASKSRSGGER